MATAVEIMNIVVKSITLAESLDKKSAEALVRSFSPMKNNVDGRIAIVPVNTIGKIRRHMGYDITRILDSFPVLYETSLPGWSEPEIIREGHKAHSNMSAYHHYINKFTDGSGEYYIRFTISETKARPGKIGRNIIHSAAVSYTALYEKGDHSQCIWEIDPGRASPSPFIDKRLQGYLTTYCRQYTIFSAKCQYKNRFF